MKFEIEAPDGRKLEIEGDIMPTEQDLNDIFGSLAPVEQVKPNIKPLTDEQKAKPKATNWADLAKEFMSGFGEGAVSGAESAINGASLGGYGWLDRKLGLGMQDRRDKLQERADEAGVGGLNQGAQLLAEIGGNIAGGGGAIAKQASKMGLKGLKGVLAANTAEGLAYGLTDSDKLEDIPINVAKNVIAGNAIPLAGRGVKVIGKGAGNLLGLTTGTGSAITNAFDAGVRKSKDFLDNMRGNVRPTDVVDKAEAHMEKIIKARNLDYEDAMSRIGVKENVKLQPIIDTYQSVRKSAGKGYLLDEGEKKVLDRVGRMLKDFSKDTTNTNVYDYDALKRAIGRIRVGANDDAALRIKTQLYNAVKDSINNQAPEYAKVMKEFSDVSDELMEFRKTLGVDKKASPAQVLKKLQSSLRNDAISGYGNNTKLVKKLQGNDNDLVDALSGQALNRFLPRGLLAGGVGALQVIGGLGSGSLGSVASALASSPRLMGELAYKAGRAKKITEPLSKPVANYLDNYTASLINILENQ
jgi:hypothetical protein